MYGYLRLFLGVTRACGCGSHSIDVGFNSRLGISLIFYLFSSLLPVISVIIQIALSHLLRNPREPKNLLEDRYIPMKVRYTYTYIRNMYHIKHLVYYIKWHRSPYTRYGCSTRYQNAAADLR